jgi:hypothetical protein
MTYELSLPEAMTLDFFLSIWGKTDKLYLSLEL